LTVSFSSLVTLGEVLEDVLDVLAALSSWLRVSVTFLMSLRISEIWPCRDWIDSARR
jgi:hypothetical protein